MPKLLVTYCTLSSPNSVEIISVGHFKFLVKVELKWVQELESSLKFSSRLPVNTLDIVGQK